MRMLVLFRIIIYTPFELKPVNSKVKENSAATPACWDNTLIFTGHAGTHGAGSNPLYDRCICIFSRWLRVIHK